MGRPRLYEFNEDYFGTIDTEDKAYFLGFIVADGCLFESKYPTISIGLQLCDRNVLEKFLKYLNCKRPIYHKVSSGREYCTIQINSKKMFEDLIKLGLTPRKSLTTIMPCCIPKYLQRHFWRGVVDGDGSLSKSDKNRPVLSLYGSHSLLSSYVLACQEITQNTYKIHKHRNIYQVALHGEMAVKMSKFLYARSEVYLDRKYEKFLGWLEEYPSKVLFLDPSDRKWK